MNNGAFGENFPYSNFHDLNMDWIIKIAKDFLDQYTNIQETIQTGLDDLDQKATDLEALLQAWYDTHSADIANQLASAIADLNAWYTQHQGYLNQYLTDSIAAFNTAADNKAAQTIASIPEDYTALTAQVNSLEENTEYNFEEFISTSENLWVNFYGTYNGVSFTPNGHGGVHIEGTANATGSFRYVYPTPYILNGMRLQYKQTNPPAPGTLYIQCRKANYQNLRVLDAQSTSGVSNDSGSNLELAMIEFIVYENKSYNTDMYVSVTNTVNEINNRPRKIVNAETAKVAEMLGNPTLDIAFWGDSITYGYGGEGTTFPMVCASQLGATYTNCGHGGESTNTIACRQGGNAWIMPAGNVNGDYVKAQMLDIYGSYVLPLRQLAGDTTATKIYVNGFECTLTRLSQSSPVSDDITYRVSGYTGTPITYPMPVYFAGSNIETHVTVFCVGYNGTNGMSAGTAGEIEARISLIDSMIAHLRNKNYVVMGLSNGTEATRSADEEKLLAHYGNNFFNSRKELSAYGMTIENLTPTTEDTAYIAAGAVPPSLRLANDPTHLTANGYDALGKLLAQKIRSLNYVRFFNGTPQITQ